MLRRIIAAAVLAAPCGAPAAEIVLRERTDAFDGPLVRLRDVATVTGRDAGRLADLPLMPAPPPGGREFLSAQAIRNMLAAQGEPVNEHRITGAYFVRVGGETVESRSELPAAGWRAPTTDGSTAFRVRRGGEVSSPTVGGRSSVPRTTPTQRRAVEEAVAAAVQSLLDRDTNPGRVPGPLAVRGVQLNATGLAALTAWTDADLTVAWTAGEPSAAGSVGVKVLAPADERGEQHSAAVDLVELPRRVVAGGAIDRGSLVTASMLRVEPTPLAEAARANANHYTTLEQAIGREAIRSLRPGEPLSDANTTTPLLVARGEEVTVSAGGGGVSVRVRAVAQAEGRHGDLVPIETLDSGDRFMARVVGPRRLAVLSGAPSAEGLSQSGGLR